MAGIRGGDDVSKAAFYYGMGIMGMIAGFGLGSTAMNKVALLVGAGALYYANELNPVVHIQPTAELQEEIDAFREGIPSAPAMPFGYDPFRSPPPPPPAGRSAAFGGMGAAYA